MNKKIGFIGAGKMAGAIIKGLLSSDFSTSDIIASEVSQEAAQNAHNELGIEIKLNNSEVIQQSDIVIFCVKPFVIKDVLKELKNDISETQTIMSIAAGISTNTIEEILDKKVPVIRIMPNTPALVNKGMSAVCKGKYAKKEHVNLAMKLLSSVGKCIEVTEDKIDAVTGISGSGPAFYYQIIEALALGGVELGLDYDTALTLSAQTAIGAAEMILNIPKSVQTLKTEVTTPGGCTAVGSQVLDDSKINDILIKTVKETAKKAYELGK